MTANSISNGDLAALEQALEAYGPDRTRWPVDVRHALSRLIATSAEAQRLVAEAETFDNLIDRAPLLSAADNAALLERIVAAAAQQPIAVHAPAQVPLARTTPKFTGRQQHGWAAAALAASLVLGVMAGGTQSVGTVSEAFGIAVSGDSASAEQQLASTDEAEGLIYEDLL